MTHQPIKQFNTYKEGLDLEFLRAYCMEHGERRVMGECAYCHTWGIFAVRIG